MNSLVDKPKPHKDICCSKPTLEVTLCVFGFEHNELVIAFKMFFLKYLNHFLLWNVSMKSIWSNKMADSWWKEMNSYWYSISQRHIHPIALFPITSNQKMVDEKNLWLGQPQKSQSTRYHLQSRNSYKFRIYLPPFPVEQPFLRVPPS